jgi:aspartate/tyrosine/aromatic aminotransferase
LIGIGSAGDRRPYADQTAISDFIRLGVFATVIFQKVLGLYRKRSGAMSFEHGAKSERRSVFDTAT